MKHSLTQSDIRMFSQLERTRNYLKMYQQRIQLQEASCMSKCNHFMDLISQPRQISENKKLNLPPHLAKSLIEILQSQIQICAYYKEEEEVIAKFRMAIRIREDEITQINKKLSAVQLKNNKQAKSQIKRNKGPNDMKRQEYTDFEPQNEAEGQINEDTGDKRGLQRQHGVEKDFLRKNKKMGQQKPPITELKLPNNRNLSS